MKFHWTSLIQLWYSVHPKPIVRTRKKDIQIRQSLEVKNPLLTVRRRRVDPYYTYNSKIWNSVRKIEAERAMHNLLLKCF